MKNLSVNQSIKAYIVNGSFVSATLLEDVVNNEKLPENVFIFTLESEWKYPTLSSRQRLVKEIEVFDPIKIAVVIDGINYKNAYIKHYINSWRIRGPDIDISGDSLLIDDLPCEIVDIMYDGVTKVTQKAEEALGKV